MPKTRQTRGSKRKKHQVTTTPRYFTRSSTASNHHQNITPPTKRSKRSSRTTVEQQHEPKPVSTLQINDMPQDCLFLVFGQLPLQQLVPLRAVCTYWKNVVEKICLQHRSLQVTLYFVNFPSYPVVKPSKVITHATFEEYLAAKKKPPVKREPNDLMVEYSYTDSLHEIGRLFTNLEALTIFYRIPDRPANVVPLEKLFRELGPNFTRLNITGQIKASNYEFMPALARSISATLATRLTSLELIFSDLRHLFNGKYYKHLSLDFAPQLIARVERLFIGFHYTNQEELLKRAAPKLKSLTALSGVFPLVPDRLPNLETLTFIGNHNCLSQVKCEYLVERILMSCAQLPKLTQLQLIDFHLNPQSTAQLPRVRTLTIITGDMFQLFAQRYCLESQLNLTKFVKTLARLFPSLHKLTLACNMPDPDEIKGEIGQLLARHLPNCKEVLLELSFADRIK